MPSPHRLHRVRRFALVLGSTAALAVLAGCGASDTTSGSATVQSSSCATATSGCALSTATDTTTQAPAGTSSAPPCTNKATGMPDTLQNGVTLTSAADGLQSGDIVAGTGAAAASGQQLTVNYTGWLSDGTIFDSSCRSGAAKPFHFALGQGNVIKGWDEGLVGLKVGGFRRLVIPPALGYGSQGAPGAIPGNATLTFDVELVAAG